MLHEGQGRAKRGFGCSNSFDFVAQDWACSTPSFVTAAAEAAVTSLNPPRRRRDEDQLFATMRAKGHFDLVRGHDQRKRPKLDH